MIGQKLKTDHQIPYIKHYMGKRLGVILKEKKLSAEMPPDLMDLMKKAVNLNAHLTKNIQDFDNRTRLRRIESKIWRLTRYYIKKGVLPSTWRYDPKLAELLIKKTS